MPDNQSSFSAIAGSYILVGLVVGLAAIIFSVIIYWRIFAKAGYSGAMGLLMFVPIANIIVICMLAFSEWPIYAELRMLRQQAMMQAAPNPQYQQQYQQYPQNPQYQSNPQYPGYPQSPQGPQY